MPWVSGISLFKVGMGLTGRSYALFEPDIIAAYSGVNLSGGPAHRLMAAGFISSKGITVKSQHTEPTRQTIVSPIDASPAAERSILSEKAFRRMIAIERKRTERSTEPFLLMLADLGDLRGDPESVKLLHKIAAALLESSRDTDVVGWYREGITAGAMFTGLVVPSRKLFLDTILSRLSAMLADELTPQDFERVQLSFHFFPDEWHINDSVTASSGSASDRTLYPDLLKPDSGRSMSLAIKRVMDVSGSVVALAICWPLFLVIAAAVKLSSPGPVFFRQTRVGQYGRPFVLYKFRTMVANCDPGVHRDFVTSLIANQPPGERAAASSPGVFKLTNDRRITRVGRILRRTSLDELPQILNVLRGNMSLVGPRPALAYELAVYQTWHRQRIVAAKPGITGLWQVNSRSRVRFDEMVRLDLRYATSWTLWLDLKIILRTPLAILRGAGAY
jgi:lipopolysaccharide/colanic/teichoic acid biosynthesis glycosyltransferase